MEERLLGSQKSFLNLKPTFAVCPLHFSRKAVQFSYFTKGEHRNKHLELVHAYNGYNELWMNAGSLESTREAKELLKA